MGCQDMNKFELSQLLIALKLIRKERLLNNCGICANVGELVDIDDESHKELSKLMCLWPKFSGSRAFPVGGSLTGYTNAASNRTLWDKSTDEGRLRFELLDYLIDTVEKIYNETNP